MRLYRVKELAEKRKMLLRLQQHLIELYDVVDSAHGAPIISTKLTAITLDTLEDSARMRFQQLIGDPMLIVNIKLPYWTNTLHVIIGENNNFDYAYLCIDAEKYALIEGHYQNVHMFWDGVLSESNGAFVAALLKAYKVQASVSKLVGKLVGSMLYHAALKGTLKTVEGGGPPDGVKVLFHVDTARRRLMFVDEGSLDEA